MKGTLKKFIMFACIFSLAFISTKSVLASREEFETKRIFVPDYFDNDELQILLPNGKLLCIGTGYAGHGNILEPFEGLSINIKDGESNLRNKFNFRKKILIRLLLPVFIEQTNFTKSFFTWSVDSKLNPLKEFIFKLFLLVNSYYYNTQNNLSLNLIFEEAFLLLIRLTQSNFDLINLNEPLSSYFPSEIREIFSNLKILFLIDFIDDAWKIFHNPKNLEVILPNKNDIHLTALVFDNSKLAKECYKKIPENCNKQEFNNSLWKESSSGKQLISDPSCIVLDYKDYLSFSDGQSVGLLDLSLDKENLDKENNDIPEKVKEIIKERVAGADGSFFSGTLIIEDNKTWVVYITNKMDLKATVLSLFKSLLKLLKDYFHISSNNKFEKNKARQNKAFINQKRNKLKKDKQRLKKQLDSINQEIIKREKSIECFDSYDNVDYVFVNIERNKLQRLRKKKEKIENIISDIEQELNEVFSVRIERFELKEILKNLNSDILSFKKIRDDFMQNLELILVNSDSDYLQKNWDIFKAGLEDIFPILKPDLEKIKVKRKPTYWLEGLIFP